SGNKPRLQKQGLAWLFARISAVPSSYETIDCTAKLNLRAAPWAHDLLRLSIPARCLPAVALEGASSLTIGTTGVILAELKRATYIGAVVPLFLGRFIPQGKGPVSSP